MAEELTIVLDGTHDIEGHKIKISLDDVASDVSGAQDVTFVDGGNFTTPSGGSGSGSGSGKGSGSSDKTVELEIKKIGKDDDAADTFRFELDSFNEDFDVSIKSEGPEDSFVLSGVSSYSESGGVYSIQFIGADGKQYSLELDPGEAAVTFVCFTPGTLIETPEGPVDVAELAPRDRVLTRDHGAQFIRHVLRRDVVFSDNRDAHKPVLLPRHALGRGAPDRDLVVSPNHRILFSGDLCELLFGTDEVLAPAKALIGLPGVRQKRGVEGATYIGLVLDHHEVVTAAGQPCETLLLTPYTVDTLPYEQWAALVEDLDGLMPGHEQPARMLLTTSQTEVLVQAMRACSPQRTA